MQKLEFRRQKFVLFLLLHSYFFILTSYFLLSDPSRESVLKEHGFQPCRLEPKFSRLEPLRD